MLLLTNTYLKGVLASGVLRGSNFSPLLFQIFFNDTTSVLDSEKMILTGDMKVYKKIYNFSDRLSLQNDLKDIEK